MSDDKVSASGERAAMGGYVPQFNEFARFAYRELVNKNLEWLKIADPDAEKLDDIQYATQYEIHAYQVKWTIADQTISFANFNDLLPKLIKSWQNLRALNNKGGKKVIAHLLTNKALSKHDSIEIGGNKIGNFSEFFNEVWLVWKQSQSVDKKWDSVIKELIATTGLSESEFKYFIECFEFHPEHIGQEMKVLHSSTSIKIDDLHAFRSFLLQNVSDPSRKVLFTKNEIISSLGWESRFKTTFNHELFVDKNRYQSIDTTINDLDEKLKIHSGGYIFLLGGPGTGKSTLLTEWVKTRNERIVKYYAFDFSNPSSARNFHERGDSTNLYFDLVQQLKDQGFYKKDILLYKDLIFLKSVFLEQLEYLGEEFIKTGKRTIILIDGLDHVPREYKSVAQSFLRDLPLPPEVREGVFIVLGSQSYELEDLSQEIKAEWKSGTRSVFMSPLANKDVINYIHASKIDPALTDGQIQVVVEKSQGHPLYLSYLVEKIRVSENRDSALNASIMIDGNIDTYYQKIWEPIRNDANLVQLLGLMARINDSIYIDFIGEWDFPDQTLISFRKNAKILFGESKNEWTFFHNSFRQFLLFESARNLLTDSFEQSRDNSFHKRLAELYQNSGIEQHWKKNFHLYRAGLYDEFISETSSEIFFEQMVNFRPTDEIKRDIKLGIEIAQKKNDVIILVRYLFAMAEIDRRLFNIAPASYIEEYLALNKISVAKEYVRNGTHLLINQKFALKVARWFSSFGEYTEG